jgi:subtilisin family serine protease
MNLSDQRYRLPPIAVQEVVTALAETIDWGLAAYGIPRTWKATRGQNVTVAVLDTGIDSDHADLAGSVAEVRDFTASRGGARDGHGHGTHVAGIIAARQNEHGVVGVAPQCRLLIAKVLDDNGSGTSAAIAAGIDWACHEGADILSLSFGSPQPDQAMLAALDRAVEQRRYVICAAGNEGRDQSIHYPARWPLAVAVGAVDRTGRLASFSSRGNELDICAPGESVLSTWKNGGYARLSGTSMAAPFVSGVVALMLAAQRNSGSTAPAFDQRKLLARLKETAVDAGAPGHDPQYGYGLIDPERLIAAPIAPQPTEIRIGPVRINGVEGSLIFVPNQ